MEGKVFADGFSFKRNENAPQFVVGRLSLKVDEAIEFIKAHAKKGWINLDVKKARTGNYYIELDNFVPEDRNNSTDAKSGGKYVKKKESPTSYKSNNVEDDGELPF